MGLRKVIVERGRQVLLRPSIVRWATSDRVMKATEGVLDARTRVVAAWKVLRNGYDLPNVDPALDENIATERASQRPVRRPSNGHGGNGASAAAVVVGEGS